MGVYCTQVAGVSHKMWRGPWWLLGTGSLGASSLQTPKSILQVLDCVGAQNTIPQWKGLWRAGYFELKKTGRPQKQAL